MSNFWYAFKCGYVIVSFREVLFKKTEGTQFFLQIFLIIWLLLLCHSLLKLNESTAEKKGMVFSEVS